MAKTLPVQRNIKCEREIPLFQAVIPRCHATRGGYILLLIAPLQTHNPYRRMRFVDPVYVQ